MPSAAGENMSLFDQDLAPALLAAEERVRVRMLVAYHGARFRGFAENRGVRTVGGVLAESLGRLLGHPVDISVAGRTDKGVHAWGNVVSFDARAADLDLHQVQSALNKMLQAEIIVREVTLAEPDFDARFSARSRTYRYTVLCTPTPDPFMADRSWHISAPLSLSSLRLTCEPFIGTHDFSSFCRQAKRVDGTPADLTRRVLRARWDEISEGLLRFEIEANAFCHQMVRSIVGTMVEAGMGVRHPGEISGILRARDRHAAGRLAPPQGLMLWSVRYG